MFAWVRKQSEFRSFLKLIDYAQQCPHGSDDAINACQLAFQYLEQSDQWPFFRKDQFEFFKGLVLFIDSRSAIIHSKSTKQAQQVFASFEEGLRLLLKFRFHDGWVACAMHLTQSYADHSHIDSDENGERAIELINLCKEHWAANGSSHDFAISCFMQSGNFARRSIGQKHINILQALKEIRLALNAVDRYKFPQDWASFKSTEAGLLLKLREKGSKENYRLALVAFQESAEHMPDKKVSVDWGILAGKWADALLNSPIGKQTDNIETALVLVKSQFDVPSPPDLEYPNRGSLHQNLAVIYAQRTIGDRLENLTTALKHAENGLDIFEGYNDTDKCFVCNILILQIKTKLNEIIPKLFANIDPIEFLKAIEYFSRRNNERGIVISVNALTDYYTSTGLGFHDSALQCSIMAIRELANSNCISDDLSLARIKEQLATLLLLSPNGIERAIRDEAISLYNAAIDFFEYIGGTRHLVPARINLAITLYEETSELDPLSVEKAISILQELLQDESVQDDVVWLSRVQSSLGSAYLCRTLDEPNININTALDHYHDAVTTCQPEKSLFDWSKNTIMLASALLEYGENGDALDRVNLVLDHLQEPTHKILWAEAKLTRAKILTRNFQNKTSEAREKVISEIKELCHNLDKRKMPHLWSNTNVCLAESILAQGSAGGKTLYFDDAIQALLMSLQVYTAAKTPSKFFRAKVLLASIYAEMDNWKCADRNFQEAFCIPDFSLSFNSNYISAKGMLLVGDGALDYAPLAALMVGDTSRSITYLEMLKARTLLDAGDMTNGPNEGVDKFKEKYRQNVRRLAEGAINYASAKTRQTVVDLLESEVLKQHKLSRASSLSDGERIDAKLSQLNKWVFIPIITLNKSRFVLIPPTGNTSEAIVSPLFHFGEKDIIRAIIGSGVMQTDNYIWSQYQLKKNIDARPLARALRKIEFDLWQFLGRWLSETIHEIKTCSNRELSIIANGYLAMLPIGLAGLNSNPKGALCEQFEMSASPNLSSMGKTSLENNFGNVGAGSIAFSESPNDVKLGSTTIERELVSHFFSVNNSALPPSFRSKSDAESALCSASYWHFATHGKFDWKRPMQSSIALADGSDLHMYEILSIQTKIPLRLVVLSSCDVGSFDVFDKTNEFTGLPSAFLQIGACGVIAALWPVADEATALLMAKFYETHILLEASPAASLKTAQLWLSSVTAGELLSQLTSYADNEIVSPKHSQDLCDALSSLPAHNRPFQNPIFWAAFVLFGE